MPRAIVLNSLNSWIHSQARRDPELAGMGCTFTALVLRGRTAHVLHVGDSRAYRLSRDHLSCLTTDHVRQGRGAGRSNILTRALGVETEVRLDYNSQPVAQHDRFLLCSDGVHGFLADEFIAAIMRERVSSEDTARALVAAAFDAGSSDNCTALVLDVVGLETADTADIGADIAQLPMIAVPQGGETIDGFVLKVLLSDGRYTRLFGAEDEVEGGEVALKFPKPLLGSVDDLPRGFRPRGLGGRAGAAAPGSAKSSRCRRGGRAASTRRCRSIRASFWRPGSRVGPRWVWRKAATSRSSWRARPQRCIAPASSIATSSRTT